MINNSLPQLSDRVKALEARVPSSLNWRGAFVSGTVYSLFDVVSYNNSTYICGKTHFNKLPTDTGYWGILPGTLSGTFANPMTTAGDVMVGGASGAPARLAKGANSSHFGVDAGGNLGYYPNTDFNPMTTIGDLIFGGVAGAALRMPKGANNSHFGVDAGGNLGYYPNTDFNPMTTQGDIIAANVGGVPNRIPKPAANYYWGTSRAGVLDYQPIPLTTADITGGTGTLFSSGTNLAISAGAVVVSSGRPIDVFGYIRGHNNVAGQYTQFNMFVNGSILVGEIGTETSSNANDFWTMSRHFVYQPAAGTYTFQIFGLVSGGTASCDVLALSAAERLA
jgi:hypothetical protein